MKWKNTTPKHGDVRTIKRFAWFPIDAGNITVWLDVVYIDQKYVDDETTHTLYDRSKWFTKKVTWHS